MICYCDQKKKKNQTNLFKLANLFGEKKNTMTDRTKGSNSFSFHIDGPANIIIESQQIPQPMPYISADRSLEAEIKKLEGILKLNITTIKELNKIEPNQTLYCSLLRNLNAITENSILTKELILCKNSNNNPNPIPNSKIIPKSESGTLKEINFNIMNIRREHSANALANDLAFNFLNSGNFTKDYQFYGYVHENENGFSNFVHQYNLLLEALAIITLDYGINYQIKDFVGFKHDSEVSSKLGKMITLY